MKTKIDNSKSLWKLREFCSNPPQGMISYWWFNGLVNAFPLHFLYYSQFSKDFVGTKERAREKIIERFRFKIENILKYPVNESQIQKIEKLWDEMDMILAENKQIQNN